MAKQKACKICKTIFEGEKCTNCESKELTDTFKGRVIVLNPEKSLIAEKLNLKQKGEFAIKTR